MRTKKEIKLRKAKDVEYILCAVTNELSQYAYLNYFDVWENNGGSQWFYDEVIDITYEVMFAKGSAYKKWLKYWKTTSAESKYIKGFDEVTEKGCFDWHHMNLAKAVWESRYDADECNKDQVAEQVTLILTNYCNSQEDSFEACTKGFKKAKEIFSRKKLVVEDPRVAQVITLLKDLDVDGETMEHILKETAMDEQMFSQLSNTYGDEN